MNSLSAITAGLRADVLHREDIEELYEQAPCGYISLLPDGTFIRTNRTFLAWSGYAADELLGVKRFQDLLTIGGKMYHETHYAPLLRMQGSVSEIAFDLVCRDGTRLPVLINATEKRDAAGQPIVVRMTLFSATDRREYERELLAARRKAEQAVNAKAQLLAMLSHDIRGPLSAISGVTYLLERSGLSAEQQNWIRMLRGSSDNMLALVNNLLDLGKIESGALVVEARELDIHELRREVMATVAAKAEEKRLSLQCTIDERIPDRLIGDVIKIKQVLTNLLGNAVKFTKAGSVTLALSLTDRTPAEVGIKFEVADTGIGIAPERLAAIFDEYVQADSDISVRYGGSGLGLTICRRLLDLLGSEMTVDSTVGEGSRFSFELRLETAP